MVDILLNTDDLTVFGPPAAVELAVDIGPQGVRGSQIYAGIGDPNSNPPSVSDLQVNDLYINAAPGTDYGYMYQYTSQPGGNTWTNILKIKPAIYSAIKTATFTSGAASLTIPIYQIATFTGTQPTADNFVIQYSIEGTDPVACSIEVPALVGAGTDLVINFSAAKRSGTSWSNLAGAVKIHLFISVI